MPNQLSGAATFDALTAKEEILDQLIKTTKVYAPVFSDYLTPVSKMGTRVEWFDQALPTDDLVLNGAYTAGSGTMVFSPPTLMNPYSVKIGVNQIMTQNGSAIYDVTDWDPNTYTATVALNQGTDASITTTTELYMIRDGEVGENFGSQNDVFYATSDYNYISNFSYTIRIGNPQRKGQILHHIDEITFDNQVENNMPSAIRNLERRVIKDFRVQGTGGATRNGNTIQSGQGSRAGGIITLGNARGLYTASAGTTPISEDLLETDMIELRNRGAFTTINERTRGYQTAYCKAYISEATLGDLQKLIRLERAPEAFYSEREKMNGEAGTFGIAYYVNGVIIEFFVSDGIADNEILYVPREDLIQIKVLRMLEEQEARSDGDNEVRMYNCTYTVCVKNPWLLGYRSNLIRV